MFGATNPEACTAQEAYAKSQVDAAISSVRNLASTLGTNASNQLASTPQGAAALTAATQATSKAAAGESPNGLGCGVGTNFDAGVCISSIVYVFTVGLGSGLAYVGGFMFDITVALSLNSAAYALDFLSAGWTTARDLANMAFILILVYIAFTIMFRAETARTMQMLALVIFIALIINFSFFFTRLVIDVGNILAVQFYNSISAPSMAGTFATTNSNTGTLAGIATGAANNLGSQNVFKNTKDLTASIMQALNIQELFNDNNFKKFAAQTGFASKFIILSFLYIAIGACYFILAAMFFAVGIKFLVRIVVLWFLIIASPLAFVAKAIPGRPAISGYYEQWQHLLVTHAFYPAFFLFIFFFISTIMSSLASTGSNGILGGLASDLSSLSSNDQLGGFIFIASSVANVGIRLGFVVAMLYIALKASEFMGVKGADFAQKISSGVINTGISGLKWSGLQVPRAGGAAYQQTVGRGAARVNSTLATTRFGNSWLGYRLRNRVVEPVAQSSVGGARSFRQYQTAKGGELRERRANMRDVLNRELVDRAMAPGGAASLTADEMRRIESFRQREIDSLGHRRVASIAGMAIPGTPHANFWTQNKMNGVQNSQNFNDQQSEEIYRAWQRAQAGARPTPAPAGGPAAPAGGGGAPGGGTPRPGGAAPGGGPAGGGGAPGGGTPRPGGTAPGGGPAGGGGGGTPVAANNNPAPTTAANSNNPQPPPSTPSGGAAARRTPPAPNPVPANSNTAHAGGGATTSSLPPLTSSASKAIQDTRNSPKATNDNAKGGAVPTKAAPLLSTEHAANDNEHTEKLAKEIRSLRETMDELPSHLKQNTTQVTKSLREVIKKVSNDNHPAPQPTQAIPPVANDNHQAGDADKKAA